MADINNVITTSQGWSKIVYGSVMDLQVEHGKILDLIEFNERKKLGSKYSEPVWISEESGVTYNGGTGVVYDLEDAIAAESVEAQGDGQEITVRSTVSFKRLTTAVANGEAAHGRFMTKMLSNMKKTHTKRAADVIINGGSARGVIDTGGAAGTGATQNLTLSLGSCKGCFINSRAYIDIYDSTGVTKRNATGTFKINKFTPGSASHTLNVTASVAAELDAVTDADIIYFKRQKGNESVGLRTICGQTSGAYLTIDPATVPEWQGNNLTVSANMSLTKVRQGCTLSMDRGASGEFIFLSSSKVFNHFADDIEALRTVDTPKEEMEYMGGVKRIKYHLEDEMVISFVTTTLMPDTQAVVFPRETFERIGSTDMTMNLTGGSSDELMYNVMEAKNGVEFRSYSDWLTWTTDPRGCVSFNSITP